MNTEHHRDTLELPTTYHRHLTVDFKKDRKYFATVQGIFLIVVLFAVAIALVFDLPLASGRGPMITIPATVLSLLVYMGSPQKMEYIVR